MILLIAALIVFSGCNTAPVQNSVNANMSSPVNENSNGTAPSVQKIVLTAPDGLRIAGSFYESSLPNSPAVLLLHQWQSDRHSYDEFAGRMQKKGFNVLTIDGRGFGESTATDDGRTVAPERTDAAVKGMLGDVGTAFEFLSKQKNVDPAKVGIIGASYGSSLALIYSADNPQVAAVALLSPGLNYFGNMATEPAIKKFGDRPLYMIAAADDKESADAVGKLMAVGNNPRYGEKIYPHGGHGTALFNVVAAPQNNGQPQLAETLETFFIERFGFGKK